MKKLLIGLVLMAGQVFAAETVSYKVTFKSLWNAVDHVSFPGNAHFSDIVTINHNSKFQLFGLGKLVTAGFEDLAELGRTADLLDELRAAQSKGKVENIEIAPALFPQRDGDTLTFIIEVSKEKPIISLATMIAPSPDWVVGVDGLNTLINGQFIKELKIDLLAIDAGTEEGDFPGNFSINNAASRPHKKARLLNHLSGLDLPFASLHIEKL